MKDHILGSLENDPAKADSLVGRVMYRGAEISLHLDADSEPLDACLELGRQAVRTLEQLDEKARAAASKSLCKEYNDNWREYELADGQGGWESVTNPPLTESSFSSKISLESLSITGCDLCSLGYNDRGLFAGHTIFVTFFDGVRFEDVHVELFG